MSINWAHSDRRPSYPADKLTYTIADQLKDKIIVSTSIRLKLNGLFKVKLVLEDSKRNSTISLSKSYFIYKRYFICFILMSWQSKNSVFQKGDYLKILKWRAIRCILIRMRPTYLNSSLSHSGNWNELTVFYIKWFFLFQPRGVLSRGPR